MKKLIPAFILITVFFQGCNQKDENPFIIAGKWKLVSLTIHGKPWSHAEGKQSVTSFFEDSTFRIQIGDTVTSQGSYSIINSSLDMIFDANTNTPKTVVKYILTLDEKTLTLCNLENGIRPESFDKTTNSILQVLEMME